MIEFKNVKLNVANLTMLDNLNFKIEDNSVTCFVGNKNSGKTALLSLIAGIYSNYYGEILIDGKYMEECKDKGIAMIFDKREKNTMLNVFEYLYFYTSLSSSDDKNIENEIDKNLKMFSLLSYKYTNIDFLDNETYKLVQIIRAKLSNAKAVLFDNLFFSDNVEFNEKILKLIKSLIGHKTLIFAARNLNYIEEICENIGILEGGNLVEFGNKFDIYKKADLNKKVQVELYDGLEEAVELLKSQDFISNVVYDNNKISFSIDGDKEVENEILKKLLDANIKVYSFKKENITYEQLFSKLVM